MPHRAVSIEEVHPVRHGKLEVAESGVKSAASQKGL
jgi:hypothetical protein